MQLNNSFDIYPSYHNDTWVSCKWCHALITSLLIDYFEIYCSLFSFIIKAQGSSLKDSFFFTSLTHNSIF